MKALRLLTSCWLRFRRGFLVGGTAAGGSVRARGEPQWRRAATRTWRPAHRRYLEDTLKHTYTREKPGGKRWKDKQLVTTKSQQINSIIVNQSETSMKKEEFRGVFWIPVKLFLNSCQCQNVCHYQRQVKTKTTLLSLCRTIIVPSGSSGQPGGGDPPPADRTQSAPTPSNPPATSTPASSGTPAQHSEGATANVTENSAGGTSTGKSTQFPRPPKVHLTG